MSRARSTRTPGTLAACAPLALLLLATPAVAQTARTDFTPAVAPYDVDVAPDGSGHAAANDGLDLVVFAFDADGQVRWQRRLGAPVGFDNPFDGAGVLGVPEGGALATAGGHAVRLGEDGSLQAAFELPAGVGALDDLCRLADGRALGVAVDPLGGELDLVELGPDGAPLARQRLQPNYPFFPDGDMRPYAARLAPTADGGWVTAHGARNIPCCESLLVLTRHAPTGDVLWTAVRRDLNPFKDVTVLADGRVVAAIGPQFLVFDADGGYLEAHRFDSTNGTVGVDGVAATPDGGLVGVTDRPNGSDLPTTLWRLDAGLDLVWARDVGVDLNAPVAIHAGPQGHLSFFARGSGARLLRTAADGALYGACAAFAPLGGGALVPGPSTIDEPTAAVVVDLVLAGPVPVATSVVGAGLATTVVCSDPRPRLVASGGQLGGTLAFAHEQPGAPGGLSVLVLSATGGGTLTLPGGLEVGLALDALTTTVLANPAQALASLDAAGDGATAPLPVPNDPTLAGLELSFGGVAVAPTGALVQATVPATVTLF